MSPRQVRARVALVVAFGLALSQPARALDKQASAHGGKVAGSAEGFAISGSVLAGAAPYNPTYAARPNNSGRTLARLAPHLDVDLIGSRLSIPIDVNLFSDRLRAGLAKLGPSELDVISGLTTTWPLGPTAFEFGMRYERDMPIDRGSYSQSYVDSRARWLLSLAAVNPHATDWLHGGDVSGYLTLGWFTYNPTYAARPDNSGNALLRYALHAALSALDEHLLTSVNATMFTDRRKNGVTPSEIDLTLDVGARLQPFELHVAYERDMPIDKRTLVQHFVLIYASVGFEIVPNTAAAAASAKRATQPIEPDGCDLD